MKNLKSIIVASFVAAFIIGLAAPSMAATLKEIKIKVFMDCEGCKSKIEKELPKAEGVSKVSADLKSKIVTINYDPAKTNKDKLVAAIEKIGYKTEFSTAPAKHDCSKECSGKKAPGSCCGDHKK